MTESKESGLYERYLMDVLLNLMAIIVVVTANLAMLEPCVPRAGKCFRCVMAVIMCHCSRGPSSASSGSEGGGNYAGSGTVAGGRTTAVMPLTPTRQQPQPPPPPGPPPMSPAATDNNADSDDFSLPHRARRM